MASEVTNTAAVANAGGPDRTPGESSLLIDVNSVAGLLCCSPRHVWRLADAGRMPRPYKVGALCRWDRAVIRDWITQGCPAVRKAGAR